MKQKLIICYSNLKIINDLKLININFKDFSKLYPFMKLNKWTTSK